MRFRQWGHPFAACQALRVPGFLLGAVRSIIALFPQRREAVNLLAETPGPTARQIRMDGVRRSNPRTRFLKGFRGEVGGNSILGFSLARKTRFMQSPAPLVHPLPFLFGACALAECKEALELYKILHQLASCLPPSPLVLGFIHPQPNKTYPN